MGFQQHFMLVEKAPRASSRQRNPVPGPHTTYSHGIYIKKEACRYLKVLLPTSCYLVSGVVLGPGRLGLAVPELLLQGSCV